MLTPETLINDRYRIVAPIGQGGMGAVYEAVDERLRTPVALKQTLATGEELARAFEREAQLLAGLRHPALPRVIDHFVAPEGQFLVMEFFPGQDLAAALRERGAPFPIAQVLAWGDQLLDALAYLHGRSPPVIHRDIKPQNLKLTPGGEPVLLDFGLAKGSAALPTRLPSQAASVFGYTPQYAPLEQVQGAGTDPRADLYSLGATLYHLATGHAPPDALARVTAVVNARPDPLRPADELNPAVPAAVAGALAMAMALGADERFASAGAMRNALRQAQGDGPAAALGPTVVARQARVARPGAAGSTPPAPPARPGAPAGPARAAAPQPDPAPPAAPARRPAPPPERRGSLAPALLGLALGLVVIGGGLWFLLGRGRDEPAQAGPTAPAQATPDPREQQPAAAPPADAARVELDAVLRGEISSAGERRSYVFGVPDDTTIFVWTFANDGAVAGLDVAISGPDGQEVSSRCLGCGNIGRLTLRRGGDYLLAVGSPDDPGTGAYELRVSLVPPPGQFAIGADAQIAGDAPAPGAAEIGVPGAANVFGFEAGAGQEIFVWSPAHDASVSGIDLVLLGPDDQELASRCLGCGPMGRVTLRQAGTYRLAVGSADDPGTGAYELRINPVPAPAEASLALPFQVSPDRPAPGLGLIERPGARQILSFASPGNQRVFIQAGEHDAAVSGLDLVLLGPDDQELASRCLGCGPLGEQTLRQAGTYRLVVGAADDPGTGAYSLEVTVIP